MFYIPYVKTLDDKIEFAHIVENMLRIQNKIINKLRTGSPGEAFKMKLLIISHFDAYASGLKTMINYTGNAMKKRRILRI